MSARFKHALLADAGLPAAASAVPLSEPLRFEPDIEGLVATIVADTGMSREDAHAGLKELEQAGLFDAAEMRLNLPAVERLARRGRLG